MEIEPQPQQDSPLQHPRRHVRVSDGAEQDGVGVAKLADGLIGEDLSGPEVALAADVHVREFVGDPFQPCDGGEHLQALGDHLRPDPISCHHADLDQGSLPDIPSPIPPGRPPRGIVTNRGLRRRMDP